MQLPFNLQIDPSRRLMRIAIQGFFGQDIDLAGIRVGRGADLTLSATVRPTDHLNIDVNAALSWLNVDAAAGRSGRLFTAQVQRLKATYNVSSRMFLRLIGQYITTKRDPALYPFPVGRKDGFFSGSALFSYRLNWQTALFLGYGDDRALDPQNSLVKTGRQVFFKLSYAYQR